MHTTRTRFLPSKEETFQRRFTATQYDIVDPMIPQITEGRRVAVAARKEMFIDAQHRRAQRVGSLCSQSLEHPLKPALRGGRADPFPLAQPSPADPIPVT